MIGSTFSLFLVLFLLFRPLAAEQLRFNSARDWQQWQLPLGAVELTSDGTIQPMEIRKNINAALNATDFGGGIRDVGSNRADARLVMDGDPGTGWSIDPGDDPDSWFIEVDLGRGVSANSVTLVFDEARPPIELFDLLLSTGELKVDNVGNLVEGALVYRIRERFKENKRHRVIYELNQPLIHTPIQLLRIEFLLPVPGARLAEVEVEAIGDNIAIDPLQKGGGIDIVIDVDQTAQAVTLGNAMALVDGSLFQRWLNGLETRAPYDVWSHITIDLGAVYWTDLVRLIGGVVVRPNARWVLAHDVSRRSFSMKTYEVMTSDGSLAPDGTRVWTKHFSGAAADWVRRVGMADHHFELLPARYIRIVWRIWDVACAVSLGYPANWRCFASASTEEIQIFGEGYPQQVRFHSPLLDLGDTRNLNSVSWAADTPPDTRIGIRTRTGDDVVEQFTFRDKNDKEITEKKWSKLIPSFRGPVDTLIIAGAGWSPWSKLYAFSGQEFQSPSRRRYLEIDVGLVSEDRQAAARLDWLAVDFSPPLAGSVVGEIYPLEVQPGLLTEFSYFLRPRQIRTAGFDRIGVESSSGPHFTSAHLDGEPIQVQTQTTPSGFQVTFPQSIRSDQLIELRFKSPIFVQSTRFDVYLEDSRQDEPIRQRVDPGDASEQIESSTNVVGLPVSRDLFANLTLGSKTFTPNGDGINDELVIAFDLVNVLEPRPLRFCLFDLTGRLLHEQEREQVAGRQGFTWDGRDTASQLLPPGLYIAELHIAGDAREETSRHLISVAY